MDKKKIESRLWVFTLLILLSVNSCSTFNVLKKDTKEYYFVFNKYTDSIINIEGQELLVRLSPSYGLGNMHIEIFYKNAENRWMLFVWVLTNQKEVYMEMDNEQKKLVFKSDPRNELLILPYETLKSTKDR